jgi:hypothetical protein
MMDSCNFIDSKDICSEEYQRLGEVDEMTVQSEKKLGLHFIRKRCKCTVDD